MFKNFFNFIFELIKIVLISVVIIIPIRYFLIQPFYVKGASMEPSFFDHEYLIVDEISYRFNNPERGDVIVFRYPRDPQEFFIKRVVGLPGEKIEIKDGGVYVFNTANPTGILLEENYLSEDLKTYSTDTGVISLDKDEFFVLGDNRNQSKDSRIFGPVKRSFLIGRVLWRGWPVNRAGFIKNIEYSYN